VEQKSRNSQMTPKKVGARFFSVNRSDEGKQSANSTPGITIQIRLKAAAPKAGARLLTRQNTEFWVSATEEA
jgi:hypothetical protein